MDSHPQLSDPEWWPRLHSGHFCPLRGRTFFQDLNRTCTSMEFLLMILCIVLLKLIWTQLLEVQRTDKKFTKKTRSFPYFHSGSSGGHLLGSERRRTENHFPLPHERMAGTIAILPLKITYRAAQMTQWFTPPSAQGMILGFRNQVLRWAPCMGHLSPSACVSASLSLSLSLSQSL